MLDFWFIVNYFLSRMKQFCCCRWHLSVFTLSLSTINSDFVCFFLVIFISSNAGWSSQSDVSISTDPHSEVSTGTGHTTIPDLLLKKDEKKYVQYLEHLSVSQVRYCFCMIHHYFPWCFVLSTKCRRKIINGTSFKQKLYKLCSHSKKSYYYKLKVIVINNLNGINLIIFMDFH